jgi:hypothetical protein
MRECQYCKHWNDAAFGDWGECSRMRSDKDHHPVDGDTWAHSEGANGTVTTAPDFSCLMFQTKAAATSPQQQPSLSAIEAARRLTDERIHKGYGDEYPESLIKFALALDEFAAISGSK